MAITYLSGERIQGSSNAGGSSDTANDGDSATYIDNSPRISIRNHIDGSSFEWEDQQATSVNFQIKTRAQDSPSGTIYCKQWDSNNSTVIATSATTLDSSTVPDDGSWGSYTFTDFTGSAVTNGRITLTDDTRIGIDRPSGSGYTQVRYTTSGDGGQTDCDVIDEGTGDPLIGSNANLNWTITLVGTDEKATLINSPAAEWGIVGSRMTPNGTTHNFDFSDETNVTHTAAYDLGSAQGNSWVIRCRIRFEGTESSDGNLIIGLSNSDSSAGGDSNQDFIGSRIATPTANYIRPCKCNNVKPRESSDETITSFTYNTSAWYYLEVKRVSDTSYTVRFTNSNTYASGGASGTYSISAGTVTGLRYLKIMNTATCTNCGAGTFNGTIWDLKYWNQTDTSLTPTKSFLFTNVSNHPEGTIFNDTDTQSEWFLQDATRTGIDWRAVSGLPVRDKLAMHYDLSIASSITKASENRVSQLDDQSGNDLHLVQASSGAQPNYESPFSTEDGGNADVPALNMNADRVMTNSGATTAQPNTYFVVLKPPASTGTTRRPFTCGNQQVITSGSANSWSIYAGSQPAFSEDIGSGWQIWEIIFDGSSSSWKINNVAKFSGQNAGTGTAGNLELGKATDSPNNYFAEFARYDGVLTTAEKTLIYNHLKRKWEHWGITF